MLFRSTYVADIKLEVGKPEELRVAQIENVMIIVQEDLAPRRLVNLGADDEWVIDLVPFINVPQYDYDDDNSPTPRSEEHTSELQSRLHLVCRLLLEKKKKEKTRIIGSTCCVDGKTTWL